MNSIIWKIAGIAVAASVFFGVGALTTGTAHAEAIGCRSTTNAAELTGFGNWDGTLGSIEVCWNVSGGTGAWVYDYKVSTFSGTSSQNRRLSHMWLEVTEGATAGEFSLTNATIDDGPKSHSGGPADPGFPGTMYGIKIEGNDADSYMFTIRTARAPVWGDWYAKDGESTHAFNTGFTLADPLSNALIAVEADHIVRPDGRDTAVPTPAAAGLVALGLAAAVRRRRNA